MFRPCPSCDGSGRIPSPTGHGNFETICGLCAGSGRVEVRGRRVPGALQHLQQAKAYLDRSHQLAGLAEEELDKAIAILEGCQP